MAANATGGSNADPNPNPATPPPAGGGGAPPPNPAPPSGQVPPKTEISKPAEVDAKALKLPDGSLLDPSRVEKIAAFARERGFSQEQAQVIVERESDAVAAHLEAARATAAQWVDQAKADPELAGKDPAKAQQVFAGNVELAKRAIDKFATAELKKALNETGFGNHPEVLRLFMKVGKAMADDKYVPPGSSHTPAPARSAAEIMYPANARK